MNSVQGDMRSQGSRAGVRKVTYSLPARLVAELDQRTAEAEGGNRLVGIADRCTGGGIFSRHKSIRATVDHQIVVRQEPFGISHPVAYGQRFPGGS